MGISIEQSKENLINELVFNYDIPELAGAMTEVLHYLGSRLDLVDGEVVIQKTDDDLFEAFSKFQFRTTNKVSLFQTERGSVYLFGIRRPSDEFGISVRFKISEDGTYYTLCEPSSTSIFGSKRSQTSRIPRVNERIREVSVDEQIHVSSKITRIDE